MAGDHLAADGDDEVDPQRLDGHAAIAGLAIGRQDDGRLVAEPGQLDGQGAGDVGQPAGLRKRNCFTGGQEDIHATSSVVDRRGEVKRLVRAILPYFSCPACPFCRDRYNRKI